VEAAQRKVYVVRDKIKIIVFKTEKKSATNVYLPKTGEKDKHYISILKNKGFFCYY